VAGFTFAVASLRIARGIEQMVFFFTVFFACGKGQLSGRAWWAGCRRPSMLDIYQGRQRGNRGGMSIWGGHGVMAGAGSWGTDPLGGFGG